MNVPALFIGGPLHATQRALTLLEYERGAWVSTLPATPRLPDGTVSRAEHVEYMQLHYAPRHFYGQTVFAPANMSNGAVMALLMELALRALR